MANYPRGYQYDCPRCGNRYETHDYRKCDCPHCAKVAK